ncbi:MAG: ATP-dependent 6-phosphofructokinase [Pseudomonadota bacterium]|nr:ATP-dependent 6-phosphofructokinase [Pseudomonadota bacterium]
MGHSVGILTGGGDAPGLNAVIRAVIKYGVGRKGWRLLGIEDSFNGLLTSPLRITALTPVACKGLLQRGGTILGTTNRGDPFHYPGQQGTEADRSGEVAAAMKRLGLEGLIVLGGDGTQRIVMDLASRHGVKAVGVPKTIDNDLGATDLTFGFQSAVDCVTDALDRLHTTAESHDRVLVLEVMGRDAGWIGLSGGVAGGADVILIPEIPWTPQGIVQKIEERRALGRNFSLIIVSEGARVDGKVLGAGKAGSYVAEAIEAILPGIDTRVIVLGHLQRGGGPDAFDRVLATRFGVCAVDLVEAGRWGELVTLRNGKVDGVPLEEARINRNVHPDDELVRAARAVGISFGD